MALKPIELYGSDSIGYLTLMGQYAAYAGYRLTRILAYHSTDIPYPNPQEGPDDDPPWRRPVSDLTPIGSDDIEIVLYLPIHRDESITLYGEMLHVDPNNNLIKIAEQPSVVFDGNSAIDDNASRPVHFTKPADVWRHARVAFSTTLGSQLKGYLAEQGPGHYYLFRMRMKITQPEAVIHHREENGYLLLE